MKKSKPKENVANSSAEVKYDIAGSYASYLDYNKILRTWFVAIGIGGPSLFLVNPKIAERLVEVGQIYCVASLFLIAAAAQVIGAFVNKFANWYVYSSAELDSMTRGPIHHFAEWLVEQFWIDMMLDFLTMACLGVAVWKLLTVFA